MKNLTVKIKYREVNDPTKGYKIIAPPFVETVEFDDEMTKLFKQYVDDTMLNRWCSQVLKLEHPNYNLEIISTEIITNFKLINV